MPARKTAKRPKKKAVKLTPAHKRKIAQGKVAGKPRKQIAKEAGVVPATVTRFGQRPQDQALLDAVSREHEAELHALHSDIITSCRKDLIHRKPEVRSTARREGMAIILAADRHRGPDTPGSDEGQWTLQELMVSYHLARGPGRPRKNEVMEGG